MDQEVGGLPGKHLSAQLIPEGRGSTEADWHLLGEVTAVPGVPADALLLPLTETEPNDVHH